MRRLCMGCMEKYNDQLAFCPHCGRPFQCEPEQPYYIMPGTVLHQRYIVGKVLGSGGFGITYIGWDYLLERKVAIKEYFPREYVTRMMNQQQVVVYPGERESWYRKGLEKVLEEAKRLAKFEAVSGIVQIYDCFPENGTSYIVMEFLEGMTLKEYLDKNGPMEEEYAIDVVLQIAWAMEVVHAAGILHRDISPDNIYVLNPESLQTLEVKLLDFGAARYSATKEQRSLSVIIKPGYAPEEQYYRRGEQGPWTDVYGLAATLYKMLTGITPENALERKARDELKRPSKLGFSLSKPTEAALMNALHIDIRDRTQSMEEFADELNADSVKERKRRENQAAQRWVAVAASGICLAALIVITVWYFSGVGNREQSYAMQLVRVPNVINMDVDEANRLLVSHGLKINKEDAKFSDEIAKDRIVYQDQKEGTMVEAGAIIRVEISKGKESYPLPVVFGLSAEEAQAALAEAGFSNVRLEDSQEDGAYDTVIGVAVNGISQITSGSGESGDGRLEGVITWLEQLYAGDGEGAELVEKDAEILLTICKKEPELEDAEKPVPDVSGKSAKEAREMLEEAGFQVNLMTEHSEAEEGTVIGQEPAAGEMAEASAFVTVKVSLGPEMVIVPDVRFMDVEKAEKMLEENGLVLGGTQDGYNTELADGVVITQSIAPDTEVPKGQKIVVVVNRKPEKEDDGDEQGNEKSSGGTRQTTAAPQMRPSATPAPTQPPTVSPIIPVPPTLPFETITSALERSEAENNAEISDPQNLADADNGKENTRSRNSENQNPGKDEVKEPKNPISEEEDGPKVINRVRDEGSPGSEGAGSVNSGGWKD